MKHPSDFHSLQQWSPGLYTTMRKLKLAGVPLGRRMVVLEHDGQLMLQSAFVADSSIQQSIHQLGKVTDIVVPTIFHDTFLDEVIKAYPQARYYYVEGAQKLLPDTLDTHPMSDLCETPWNDVLKEIPLKGAPKLNESAFIHQPSNTLLVSDLFFNIEGLEGWWLQRFAKMLGFAHAPRPSRLFKSTIKDNQAFCSSLREILQHDFDRILTSHFQCVPTHGKKVIEDILNELSE